MSRPNKKRPKSLKSETPPSPKRRVGEVVKEDRWKDWPFGFKVLVAQHGNMALSPGFLFATRLWRIHLARIPGNADFDPRISAECGEDLAGVLFEMLRRGAEGNDPKEIGLFLNSMNQGFKDLVQISQRGILSQLSPKASTLYKYHQAHSGHLLPPIAKQIRGSGATGEGAHISRTLNGFRLHLLNGHALRTLRKEVREKGKAPRRSRLRSLAVPIIKPPWKWPLANLMESILWLWSPIDVLQPVSLNFRQLSARIASQSGARPDRELTLTIRGLYELAFDLKMPSTAFEDSCGMIAVPTRMPPEHNFASLRASGKMDGLPKPTLDWLERFILQQYLAEIDALLNADPA